MKNTFAYCGFVRSLLLPVFGLIALGIATPGATESQTGDASPLVSVGGGEHISQRSELTAETVPAPALTQSEQAAIPAPSTRSSFMARWDTAPDATGYRLDVSAFPDFRTFAEGYHNLDVGNVTGRAIVGLKSGMTYFYRVWPYTAYGSTPQSNIRTGATTPGAGLVINATFDSSITNNANAVAIESTINQAVSIYESLFSDPTILHIYFRYSTVAPNGTALGSNTLALSNWGLYQTAWSNFVNALIADAKTANDTTANGSLPGSSLSTNVVFTSANGRALGFNTPTDTFPNGTLGSGGPYDGIVTVNSAQPFQFSRPTNSGKYDALRSIEHEMDEVIGLGSFLNLNVVVNGCGTGDLRPQDLFSWSSSGNRNFCSGPNGGTRYFSINSGQTDIVDFNQNGSGDLGDWFSEPCYQSHPYVQNASSCEDQYSDVTATSPEGINLDVIGYDLVSASCTYSLSPTSAHFTAAGGGSQFNVATGLSCNWTATPNQNWISITANGSGPGSKQVSFNVSANSSSSSRTGTISVAGQTFAVNQDGKTSGQANLTPYTPKKWSDKIVVTATSGAVKDAASFKHTKPLYVDWAVINNGNQNIATTFFTYLYVDGMLKQSFSNSSLPATQYTYYIGYAIGTLSHGNHTISVTTDATGVVSESNESDNSYSKPIFVN